MGNDQEKVVTLRMSEGLHKQIHEAAHDCRISMNEFCKMVLRADLERRTFDAVAEEVPS